MILKKNIINRFLLIILFSLAQGEIRVTSYGWEVFDRNTDSRISALAGTGVNALAKGLQLASQENGIAASASAGLDAIKGTITDNVKAQALFGTASTQYLRDRAASDAINALAGTNIRAADILARKEGKIVNQNLELLFNGVSLRPFNFAWDLTPRDEKEAGVIREILYKLKQSSAARRRRPARRIQFGKHRETVLQSPWGRLSSRVAVPSFTYVRT